MEIFSSSVAHESSFRSSTQESQSLDSYMTSQKSISPALTDKPLSVESPPSFPLQQKWLQNELCYGARRAGYRVQPRPPVHNYVVAKLFHSCMHINMCVHIHCMTSRLLTNQIAACIITVFPGGKPRENPHEIPPVARHADAGYNYTLLRAQYAMQALIIHSNRPVRL